MSARFAHDRDQSAAQNLKKIPDASATLIDTNVSFRYIWLHGGLLRRQAARPQKEKSVQMEEVHDINSKCAHL
jgi:hypothetical protein